MKINGPSGARVATSRPVAYLSEPAFQQFIAILGEVLPAGRARLDSDSLGTTFNLRQKSTAKLVLPDEGISQYQIQKRHLSDEIPDWMVQDQNQKQDQHARIRHQKPDPFE